MIEGTHQPFMRGVHPAHHLDDDVDPVVAQDVLDVGGEHRGVEAGAIGLGIAHQHPGDLQAVPGGSLDGSGGLVQDAHDPLPHRAAPQHADAHDVAHRSRATSSA